MSIVFGTLSKLLAVAAGAIYAGIVLMRFRAGRPHYRLCFELRDPGRSVEKLVIWPGVKVLEGCLRIANCILNILLAHISILNAISESSDRRHHQYLCGCEHDEEAPEVSTQWMRYKIRPFSYRSTAL